MKKLKDELIDELLGLKLESKKSQKVSNHLLPDPFVIKHDKVYQYDPNHPSKEMEMILESWYHEGRISLIDELLETIKN